MPKGKIPSIQITEGMSPTAGRITMPIGTFLNQTGVQSQFSNPATAAAGSLSVPQINIPQAPAPSPFAGTGGWRPPTTGVAPFLPQRTEGFNRMFGLNKFDPNDNTLKDPEGNPVMQYRTEEVKNGSTVIKLNPVAYDNSGNKWIYDHKKGDYVRQDSGAFSNTQPNNFVGAGLGEQPKVLDAQTAMKLFQGRSFNQVKESMETAGYVMNSQGQFVLGAAKPASGDTKNIYGTGGGSSYGVDERGRPIVNVAAVGASLESNQIVNAANAVIRGGTALEDGTKQYSRTARQTLNKKLEAKGAYKWVKTTYKDENGNWVASFHKELRAPYTRKFRKQQAAKQAEQAKQYEKQAPLQPTQPTQPVEPEYQPANFNQLVTLRTNFG